MSVKQTGKLLISIWSLSLWWSTEIKGERKSSRRSWINIYSRLFAFHRRSVGLSPSGDDDETKPCRSIRIPSVSNYFRSKPKDFNSTIPSFVWRAYWNRSSQILGISELTSPIDIENDQILSWSHLYQEVLVTLEFPNFGSRPPNWGSWPDRDFGVSVTRMKRHSRDFKFEHEEFLIGSVWEGGYNTRVIDPLRGGVTTHSRRRVVDGV